MKNGSSYQAANVMRRNSIVSAHSSAGDASCLPHGVVSVIVWYWPSALVVYGSERTHRFGAIPAPAVPVRPRFRTSSYTGAAAGLGAPATRVARSYIPGAIVES